MKNKIKLIAETAWHHDGNFPFMKKLVSDILNLGRADVLKMHLLLNYDEYANSSYRNYNTGIKKLFPVRQWTDLIGMIQTNKKELMLFGKADLDCCIAPRSFFSSNSEKISAFERLS